MIASSSKLIPVTERGAAKKPNVTPHTCDKLKALIELIPIEARQEFDTKLAGLAKPFNSKDQALLGYKYVTELINYLDSDEYKELVIARKIKKFQLEENKKKSQFLPGNSGYQMRRDKAAKAGLTVVK